MLLTIDIGNTNILLGVFRGEELVHSWRISTDSDRTGDEYGVTILGLLASSGLKEDNIKGAIFSCVVPSLENTFKDLLKGYMGTEPVVVGPGLDTGIRLAVDNPEEVGSDRVVNAVAAFKIHRAPLIIVDFGTAVTFDYVTESGEYAGGAIAPGIRISSDALCANTAKLPMVEVTRPEKIVGRNTVDSIRAGIFYGFVSLVDGIIERMKQEVGTNPKVIATGGLAGEVMVESRTIDEVDEFLTLKGLKVIHERLR